MSEDTHFVNSNRGSTVAHIADPGNNKGARCVSYCGIVSNQPEVILFYNVGMNMQGYSVCKNCTRFKGWRNER